MRKLANGGYGEKVWEQKINAQNEVGVIFGVVSNLKEVKKDTFKFMRFFDKEIKPLIKKHAKILDLGVGPLARFSIEFSKRGYNVTGVDISNTILQYAKKYIDKEGLTVRLLKEDITEIDNIKEKFDFVFCSATFYHVPPHLTPIALMKMNKILDEKGKLLIEFGLVTKKSFKDCIKIPLYYLGHYTKRLFGKGFKVNVSRFTVAEIKEMVEKSGFRIEKRFRDSIFLLSKK